MNMFGQATDNGESMLSGMMSLGDSMFNSLGTPDKYKLVPDPEEMAAKMASAQVVRKADLCGITARSYDLSDEQQVEQYQKDREWVLMGMSMGTHYLMDQDKQFIATMEPPRWIAHMEWAEFKLVEKPVEPIGSAPEE